MRPIRALRRDPLEFVSMAAREGGDICAFRIGPARMVVLSSPELIRQVLVQDASRYSKGPLLLRALRPLLGEGLLTSSGELHERQRALIAPYFFSRELSRHVRVIAALGEAACEEWAAGSQIDLAVEMQRLATRLAGRLVLDVDLDGEPRLVDAISEAFAWEMHALTNPLSAPLRVPTARNLRMQQALTYIHKRLEAIIEDRVSSGADRDGLLSMLLSQRDAEGRPLTRKQVHDELLTLCGAALESTADALAWTLYLLAANPDVGARVREEADAALGGRRVDVPDLANLPTAQRAFKESLRLYPPAAIIVRAADCDMSLGGYEIRSGTTMILACWVLHRRPDVFLEPDVFDPERFNPTNESRIPKGGYLPFGAGPRVCIGGGLALLEGQILTATIAQRVEFELEPGHEVIPNLQMNVRARDGILARVHQR